MAEIDDPVLRRFRTALDAAYGDRIERVVLFGSRARGERTGLMQEVRRDGSDL